VIQSLTTFPHEGARWRPVANERPAGNPRVTHGLRGIGPCNESLCA
jgi:hypothetical protein